MYVVIPRATSSAQKKLVITDFGELDCYQAQFIVGNNITAHNILILREIMA